MQSAQTLDSRRKLLVWSSVTIATTWFGLYPSEIGTLGITLPEDAADHIVIFLIVLVLYHLGMLALRHAQDRANFKRETVSLALSSSFQQERDIRLAYDRLVRALAEWRIEAALERRALERRLNDVNQLWGGVLRADESEIKSTIHNLLVVADRYFGDELRSEIQSCKDELSQNTTSSMTEASIRRCSNTVDSVKQRLEPLFENVKSALRELVAATTKPDGAMYLEPKKVVESLPSSTWANWGGADIVFSAEEALNRGTASRVKQTQLSLVVERLASADLFIAIAAAGIALASTVAVLIQSNS